MCNKSAIGTFNNLAKSAHRLMETSRSGKKQGRD